MRSKMDKRDAVANPRESKKTPRVNVGEGFASSNLNGVSSSAYMLDTASFPGISDVEELERRVPWLSRVCELWNVPSPVPSCTI